jgi:hypothetical protein
MYLKLQDVTYIPTTTKCPLHRECLLFKCNCRKLLIQLHSFRSQNCFQFSIFLTSFFQSFLKDVDFVAILLNKVGQIQLSFSLVHFWSLDSFSFGAFFLSTPSFLCAHTFLRQEATRNATCEQIYGKKVFSPKLLQVIDN